MPANLTPEFIKAREQYSRARTPEEKFQALKQMLATIPKHKGTEHMQGDIRRRLAEVRRELQTRKKSKRGVTYRVPPEGAAQVILLGAPNSGKSSILDALTNAAPQIAEYPFTTRVPLPGMIDYEDIQIQLVDTPPITEQFMQPWMNEVLSTADAALLVCDLSAATVLEDIEGVRTRLSESKIQLVGRDRRFEESDSPFGARRIKTMLLGNKCDAPEAEDNFAALKELYEDEFEMMKVSAKTGENLNELPARLFRFLRIVRVYTKEPGKKPDLERPFVLREGQTVLDLARKIHKEFVQKLKYARIWGSGEFDGQPVSRDHVLRDGDVVELHIG